ncbi:MAG: outer membrane lipoprotein LolB [Gammaproteobacteria bacterium]|nr:outer membrane lipoprotein LolB [Gammaproteobacteria bacterium]
MPIINKLNTWLLMITILLLSSCSTLTRPSASALNQLMSWNQRKAQLAKICQWQIHGAIAIKTAEQRLNAHLYWQQKDLNTYQILLFGPLAINTITVDGKMGKVTLLMPNRPALSAKNSEQLLQQQLGWHLPISNLYYWVRGLPSPQASSHKTFDHFHHLTFLRQQQWTIHYEHYMNVEGIDLPDKIELNNPKLNIRMIIASWKNT